MWTVRTTSDLVSTILNVRSRSQKYTNGLALHGNSLVSLIRRCLDKFMDFCSLCFSILLPLFALIGQEFDMRLQKLQLRATSLESIWLDLFHETTIQRVAPTSTSTTNWSWNLATTEARKWPCFSYFSNHLLSLLAILFGSFQFEF